MTAPLLVSVHLPKTAGTSFASSLADHFGERLYRDYGDAPLNTVAWKRAGWAAIASLRTVAVPPAGIDCVHGHFLPLKYRLLGLRRPVRFVTWMRDPVERLASHYAFWKQSYDPRTSRPLHRQVVEEGWSFERFCRSPRLRNVYAKFLWGIPLARFDFVGITEHYDEDFRFFADRFLQAPVPAYRERMNAERRDVPYVTDARLRAEIEALHRHDMRLYRAALARRRLRTGCPHADSGEPPLRGEPGAGRA